MQCTLNTEHHTTQSTLHSTLDTAPPAPGPLPPGSCRHSLQNSWQVPQPGNYTKLHSALNCSALYCTLLHGTALHCTTFHFTKPDSNLLHRTSLHQCSVNSFLFCFCFYEYFVYRLVTNLFADIKVMIIDFF